MIAPTLLGVGQDAGCMEVGKTDVCSKEGSWVVVSSWNIILCCLLFKFFSKVVVLCCGLLWLSGDSENIVYKCINKTYGIAKESNYTET